jgi:hypothetical protein
MAGRVLRPAEAPADLSDGRNWTVCDQSTSRHTWHPKLGEFFEYWLAVSPPGRLPGRQHFDPLKIASIMPHVWMLDVVRDGGRARYRYRLAGTREVETLQREVTGQWFDEVHRLDKTHPIYERFGHMADHGVATYRRGKVGLSHEKDHRLVENCMLPFAADGQTVDLIAACSIVFYSDGREVP